MPTASAGLWIPPPEMIPPTSNMDVSARGSGSSPIVSATEAHEHIICNYIVISSLSVFIWDVLSHLRDDYHILTKHRITLPTVVYFLARLFTLLYLIGYTIIQMTPVGHCNLAIRLATSPLVIALPASQLLLFLHVRAIYAAERVIVWFFTFLWVSTLVTAAIAVGSISGINIGPTDYCTPAKLARVDIGAIIAPLVNDTLLFVALVARLMKTSSQDMNTCKPKDRIKTALFGASVPRVAKTLLQNGQQYFLATIIINLASLVLYASSRNFSLGFPSVMLTNLMVSRLYRQTKLTRYDGLNVSFAQGHGFPLSRPIVFAHHPTKPEESDALDSASGSMTIDNTAHSVEESHSGGLTGKLNY